MQFSVQSSSSTTSSPPAAAANNKSSRDGILLKAPVAIGDAGNPSVEALRYHSQVCCIHNRHHSPGLRGTIERIPWRYVVLLLVLTSFAAVFGFMFADLAGFYLRYVGFLVVNGLPWPGWSALFRQWRQSGGGGVY